MAEHAEILDLKSQRKRLFELLNHVIEVCQRKFDMEKARNSDRQKWARIIISAVDSYGKLLETACLEDLDCRVKQLEEMTP